MNVKMDVWISDFLYLVIHVSIYDSLSILGYSLLDFIIIIIIFISFPGIRTFFHSFVVVVVVVVLIVVVIIIRRKLALQALE